MRLRLVAAGALMVAVALSAGCNAGVTAEETTQPGATSPSSGQVTSPGTGDTADTSATVPAETDGSSGSAVSSDEGLSSSDDQEAISRELETIIQELDEMSLPDDTDFQDIEDALE